MIGWNLSVNCLSKRLLSGLLACFVLSTPGLSFAQSKPPIEISLRASQQALIDSDPIQVEFSFYNASSTPHRFLTWGTPLEKPFWPRYLKVSYANVDIQYLGIIEARVEPSEAAYIDFAPFETKKIVVDLSRFFAFQQPGEYEVRLQQNTSRYRLINSVTLSLAKARTLAKVTPAFRLCEGSEASQAESALARAESWLRVARDDIDNTPTNLRNQAQRYLEWFGSYDAGRWSTVSGNFRRMYSAASGRRFTFDCGCADGGPDTIAYVFSGGTREIYFCRRFFLFQASSQAEVMVHEISHLADTANTRDVQYGFNNSKNLAKFFPNDAIRNADNYAFFAHNSPPLSMPSSGGSSGGDSGGEGGTGGVNEPGPIEIEEPDPIVSPILQIILDE